MQLSPGDIHVWSKPLLASSEELENYYQTLNPAEKQRAERFHFAVHRNRFIIARASLRILLNYYLGIEGDAIEIEYTDYEKPVLPSFYHSNLQFNIAHSADLAVFAFTESAAIGVDIEKIESDFMFDVAKRFFNASEQAALMQHPVDEQSTCFYRLWSRKEAIVKADGQGIRIPLSTFSVSAHDVTEMIALDGKNYWLSPLPVATGYQAALALAASDSQESHPKIFLFHLK